VREAKSKPRKDEQPQVPSLITLALKRFRLAADSEQRLRRDALDDLEFRIGKQWPSDIETSRTQDGRPCLTMNRIPAFLRQVTNEQRQQRPAVQVNPVGDGADIETAEIIEGVIRHIEVNSDAEVAYDHAFEMMATIGFGYWRIITEYETESFDQQILIKRIKNPFTVYFDPTAIEPDYSDAKWAFIVEDLLPDEYRSRYGNTQMASLKDFATVGDHDPEWANREFVRVAEYFYTEEVPETLVQTASGTYRAGEEPTGEDIQQERRVMRQQVCWRKINAVEVIEERDWPGQWIPIVPVLGDDLDVDGKRYLAGMVRNAKDPQRMYNYQISAATEASALQPKAPFLVADGQIEGFEDQWRQANVRNFAFLPYHVQDTAGKPIPPPQRQSSDTQLASYSFLIRQADNDLKATTGIFDASLGEKGPDQSGRAILARQKQGDIANLNWTDNLARSIRHTGRILIDLIPRIVTRTKIQRIINPDRSVKHVAITNSHMADADLENPVGYDKVYDVGVGIYDVSVSVGPSYQSKRQEAVASQMALINSYPQMMQIAGDLLVRNMDWPGAEQIAERLYKSLPPQLQDQDTQDPKKALMGAQATVQQLQQQLQQATALIQQQHEIIQTEQVKQSAESQREAKRLEAQIVIAKINASKDLDKAAADRMIAEFEQATDHAHELAMAQVQAQQPQPVNGGAQPQAGGQQPAENPQNA